MKDRLTPEQSQRLIELGVDPSKASAFNDLRTEKIFSPGDKPIFDLSDILSLLPKELCESRDGIRSDCHLSMYGYNKTWGAIYRLNCGDDYLVAFDSPELIDALYELLCWVLKNHPDKIKRL